MLTALAYRFDTSALAALVRALLLATGLIVCVCVCVVAVYAPLILTACACVVTCCAKTVFVLGVMCAPVLVMKGW